MAEVVQILTQGEIEAKRRAIATVDSWYASDE